MNNGMLDNQLVSLHFQRADKGDGEIRFGGINTGFYSGSLIKVPNVSLVGLWEVAVVRFQKFRADGRMM
jgi:Eukaryotic aspartyl protease